MNPVAAGIGQVEGAIIEGDHGVFAGNHPATVRQHPITIFRPANNAPRQLECFAGRTACQRLRDTFYKTSTRPFSIGDRIEVNGIRGDVFDIGLMATQILEVGPGNLTHQYTGRSVTIPNSIFLNHNIINESYSTDYVLHVFEVPVKFNIHSIKHQEALIKAANEVCEVHIDKAKLHFQKMARKRQMETPVIEPRVTLKINKPEEVIMIVRVTVPARSKGKIEQEILKKYLYTLSSENFFELSK